MAIRLDRLIFLVGRSGRVCSTGEALLSAEALKEVPGLLGAQGRFGGKQWLALQLWVRRQDENTTEYGVRAIVAAASLVGKDLTAEEARASVAASRLTASMSPEHVFTLLSWQLSLPKRPPLPNSIIGAV